MGKLYVVGIGPGSWEQMTQKAIQILEKSDCIIGYTVYVDLIKEYFAGKEFLTTPMRQEEKRCRMAFEQAKEEKIVSMICSGDAGVYGMAGLILELKQEYPEIEIEIIPGITAAGSGAALLGAPLMHDFAVISLSDLMTPWEKIEKRIQAAAAADFVICFYNPSSKKRKDYLKKACDLIAKQREDVPVCGIVQKIGREGESVRIMTLSELREFEADMFTTVFIGNSNTKQLGAYMVTPRGYQI